MAPRLRACDLLERRRTWTNRRGVVLGSGDFDAARQGGEDGVRQARHWLEWLEEWLRDQGISQSNAQLTAQLFAVLAIGLACVAANYLAKKFIVAWVKLIASRTHNDWDDVLVKRRVFDRLSHLAPALVIYALLPFAFPETGVMQDAIKRLAVAYMVVAGTRALDALLSALIDIYDTLPIARARPINTYVQVVKILTFFVASILVLAVLLDRSPWGFLTGLGAMTAVLLLVFKDTILGFVASIQLMSHDMVRRGDWIEVPKYGADGDVIDISVTTVKVQNWDKTISMIPTYALIADSFKNWRGMSESGGRRIKRAIHIDMNSVTFCTPQMIERFERIALLRDHVQRRHAEIEAYNREHDLDTTEIVNGRRMTNLGTFRAYVEAYLRSHPKIRQDMTFLVRQLAPDATGIPIEIYVFSGDQVWANYEAIQGDIFDHLLAVIPEFGLNVFQSPAGADVRLALASVLPAGQQRRGLTSGSGTSAPAALPPKRTTETARDRD
jgi:miniconductance mechanosensitive channel